MSILRANSQQNRTRSIDKFTFWNGFTIASDVFFRRALEDLIASRGRELTKYFPAAAELDESLTSKNVNQFYDRALMMDVGQRLLKRDGPILNFYSKRDVEDLLSEVSQAR